MCAVLIPENVYYATDARGFYDANTNELKSDEFHHEWWNNRQLFPQQKAVGIPIQQFAAQSPEHADAIRAIMQGLKDGTISLS